MPYQVWIAVAVLPPVVVVLAAVLSDGLKELRQVCIVAGVAVLLGGGTNVTAWMMTPTETKTVTKHGWNPQQLSGKVDYEVSDLSSFGDPRYVITDTRYRVLVDNVKSYPKGMTLKFACPVDEWQGHQRFGCQEGPVPTSEVASAYSSFSVRLLLSAVGLAMAEGGVILFGGMALLLRRARPKELSRESSNSPA